MTEPATYIIETLWEDEEFVLSRRVSDDEQVSILVSTPMREWVGKPWDLTPFLHVAIKITQRSV